MLRADARLSSRRVVPFVTPTQGSDAYYRGGSQCFRLRSKYESVFRDARGFAYLRRPNRPFINSLHRIGFFFSIHDRAPPRYQNGVSPSYTIPGLSEANAPTQHSSPRHTSPSAPRCAGRGLSREVTLRISDYG